MERVAARPFQALKIRGVAAKERLHFGSTSVWPSSRTTLVRILARVDHKTAFDEWMAVLYSHGILKENLA
ncbi:MAG: hypothetical protein U1D30_17990 [Planctomycetota bacterium]